ncbi:MAG: PQQ-binding-like beta-propeller repeat protein [Chitinivibrionales bacterium]|nr:PQQ-binding-like beta-propeller repeat protein [Chitinivibrionales bacterium]
MTLIFLGFSGSGWSYTFLGNNCRTNRYSEALAVPLSRVYSCSINGPLVSSPTVVNDTIYIGSRDSSCYAVYKGAVLWKFPTRGWVDASVAYADGSVYVGSRGGLLYILDSQTGDSLNAFENHNEQCASPLIYDSLIVFGRGGLNTDIIACNRTSAQDEWFVSNTQMVYSSAAFKDSLVYYGENGGSLVCLQAHTGSVLWQFQTEGATYVSCPAIDNDMVWFSPGGYDYDLYCLSMRTGVMLWKNHNTTETQQRTLPASMVKQLSKFKPQTRSRMIEVYENHIRQKQPQAHLLTPLEGFGAAPRGFVAYGGIATSSVAVGPLNVYVVHKLYGFPKPLFILTAFDRMTGKQQWYYSEMRSCAELGFCSTPMVTDSLVFVGWGEGKFYAFNANNGALLWQDSLDSDIIASPVACNGKVHVATLSGSVVTYIKRGYLDRSFENSTYCYPNPASGTVSHIQIFADNPATVRMTVYNFANRAVFSVEKRVSKGVFTHDWNLSNVANGVYFAHVLVKYDSGGKEKKIVKIAVLK